MNGRRSPSGSLVRGVRVHLNADLALPGGDYRVVAVRPRYVKVRRGGTVRKVGRRRFERLYAGEPSYVEGEGVLGALGYRVGREGGGSRGRRKLLKRLMAMPYRSLPDGENRDEWGAAKSPARLRKALRCLQGFADRVRERREMRQAVEDWDADRVWLKAEFG